MAMRTLHFGLLGFLYILQHVSAEVTSDGTPVIEIPDGRINKGDVIYTVNCSLSSFPEDCDYFIFLNKTDANQTHLHMKLDLLSDCKSLTAKLCSGMQCEDKTFSLFFQRTYENVHPIRFKNSSYTIDVPESTGTGTTLYNFNVDEMIDKTDCYFTDSEGYVFSVETHTDTFEVNDITKPSSLHLKKILDYEKVKMYNVTVKATLYDQTDTTQFIINVLDVDDMDPQVTDDPLNITEIDTSTDNNGLRTTPVTKAEDLTSSIKPGSNESQESGMYSMEERHMEVIA